MPAISLNVKANAAFSDIEGYRTLSAYPVDTLISRGYDYAYNRNMPDSALFYFTFMSTKYSPSLPKEEQEKYIEGFKGLWYTYFFYYFDYVQANKSLRKALEISDEIGSMKGQIYFYVGCMYQGIAEIGNNFNLFEEAISNYKISVAEADETDNGYLAVVTMANMVPSAYFIGETSIAAEGMDILNRQVKAGNLDMEKYGWRYNYLRKMYEGMMAMDAKDYGKAAEAFRQQLDFLTKEPERINVRFRMFAYMNLADALQRMGKFKEAEELLHAGLRLSFVFDVKDFRLQVLDQISNLHKAAGDEPKNIEYRVRYLGLKDSLVNYQQLASVSEMGMYNQMQKIDSELGEMKRRNANLHTVLGIGVVVVIFVVVGLLAIFIRNRNLKRINRMLYKKNEERLEAEERISGLLKEIDEMKERESLKERGAAVTRETDSSGTDIHTDTDIQSGTDTQDPVTHGTENQNSESKNSEKYRNSLLDEDLKNAIMGKILKVIEDTDEIYNPGFKAERLAELTGIKYKQISQVINEKTGCNFNVFLNEFRVKQACRIINTTEDASVFSIEGLANRVGFKSRNAFATAFKKFTGLNPSEYLKIARSDRKG